MKRVRDSELRAVHATMIPAGNKGAVLSVILNKPINVDGKTFALCLEKRHLVSIFKVMLGIFAEDKLRGLASPLMTPSKAETRIFGQVPRGEKK